LAEWPEVVVSAAATASLTGCSRSKRQAGLHRRN
jgi:hypothetical protein